MWHHFSGRLSVALLTALAGLAGCTGTPGGPTPADGVLTVAVQPTPTAVSGLVVSSGSVQIDELTVLGDVIADRRAMVPEFSLDLTSTTGASFKLSMLPQGVYSRVRFSPSHIDVQGTWRGTPLHVQFEVDDSASGLVDLRAADGVELAPGHDVGFAISVDDGAWFAGNLLDTATVAQSQIVIDHTNNASVGASIAARLAGSFALHESSLLR